MLGGAIATVTMLLVILSSAANGIQETMLRAATTLSTGHVNVGGFFKITSGQASPVVTHFAPLKQLVIDEVPEAAVVVDRVRGWGKVVSHKNSLQVGLSGVDIDQEDGFHKVLELVEGDLDGLREPNTLLLFESQAERLDVKVGDALTLSAPTVRGSFNAVGVTVVGIAKNIGFISGFSVFTPKETIREMYLMDDSATGAIQIYLKDYEDAEEVAERLRQRLSVAIDEERIAAKGILEPLSKPFWMKFQTVTREDWTGQKLDITTWKDEMKFLTWTIQAFDSLTFAVVGTLMVIILIGVMNSMWMAIRERTQEIGTLRAIGMGRGGVMMMFVVEASLLSFGATIAGALGGALVATIVNALEIGISKGFQLFLMRDTLYLSVNPTIVLTAIAIITVVVTIFSIYPALKAARLRPVTAMQHIG
jgi:ABC-type lipoprotein release transport system permease subunit